MVEFGDKVVFKTYPDKSYIDHNLAVDDMAKVMSGDIDLGVCHIWDKSGDIIRIKPHNKIQSRVPWDRVAWHKDWVMKIDGSSKGDY